MQDRGEAEQLHGVNETNALLRVFEALTDIGNAQGLHLILGHHGLIDQVEGLIEVDVFLVQRIPEVIVRGGDDLVEHSRPLTIAIKVEHGFKVVRRYRVIHDILGDIAVSHGVSPVV